MSITYSVSGDTWSPPQIISIISDNGRYVIRVVPTEKWKEASEDQNNKKAKAIYYLLSSDKSTYYKYKEFNLINTISPVDISINNNGNLITLDNWHSLGYGSVVTLFDRSGNILKNYTLKDFYSKDQIESMNKTVSSIWWRCRSIPPYYDTHENALLINDSKGGILSINFNDGSFKYEKGLGKVCTF